MVKAMTFRLRVVWSALGLCLVNGCEPNGQGIEGKDQSAQEGFAAYADAANKRNCLEALACEPDSHAIVRLLHVLFDEPPCFDSWSCQTFGNILGAPTSIDVEIVAPRIEYFGSPAPEGSPPGPDPFVVKAAADDSLSAYERSYVQSLAMHHSSEDFQCPGSSTNLSLAHCAIPNDASLEGVQSREVYGGQPYLLDNASQWTVPVLRVFRGGDYIVPADYSLIDPNTMDPSLLDQQTGLYPYPDANANTCQLVSSGQSTVTCGCEWPDGDETERACTKRVEIELHAEGENCEGRGIAVFEIIADPVSSLGPPNNLACIPAYP
ncbi:MAG: hypothetical protein IPJ88_11195 [Myxococcales bacterium]|nr:MAG: hypothetical protein IPJ88_11195 [Myxococcales bacterium]